MQKEDCNDWLDRGVHPARTIAAAHPDTPRFQQRWSEQSRRQLQGLWWLRANAEWVQRSITNQLSQAAVEASRTGNDAKRSAPRDMTQAAPSQRQGAVTQPMGPSALTLPYSQCALSHSCALLLSCPVLVLRRVLSQ